MIPLDHPCAIGFEARQRATLHMLGLAVVAAAEQICRDAVDREAS